MRRVRVSIAGLMAVIVLVSVGLAGMRNPTTLWASALFTITVASLCTGTLGAIAGSGHARLTWAGMAVFGWVYLGFAFGLAGDSNGATLPPFVTRALSDYMDDRDSPLGAGAMSDRRPQGEKVIGIPESVVLLTPDGKPMRTVVYPSLDPLNRRRIVHSLGAIVFALIGGVVARFLAARNDGAERPLRPFTTVH